MESLIQLSPVGAQVLMGIFFWAMAAGLLKDFKSVTGLMQAKGIPMPSALLAITILVWLAGGAALVFSFMAFEGALLLLALTAAVTPVIHNFWAAPQEDVANELQHFLKNVAIIAGLLAIIALSFAV